MSSENINRPISSNSEEDNCSDDEETETDINMTHGQNQEKICIIFILLGSQS